MTTLQLELSSYASDNLKQLKDAVSQGLLGRGKPVIFNKYNWETESYETKFTCVLCFDQLNPIPDLIDSLNESASYHLLEIETQKISWHTKLNLIKKVFSEGKAYPSIIKLATSTLHTNPSVSLIEEALKGTKGETILTSSCSHHSGWSEYSVISLGKGVVICLNTEKEDLSYDDEEPHTNSWKSCNGNLYNLIGLELNPSVKSNSEIKGEIIRKISEEEKTFLKEVYSSDLEFED